MNRLVHLFHGVSLTTVHPVQYLLMNGWPYVTSGLIRVQWQHCCVFWGCCCCTQPGALRTWQQLLDAVLQQARWLFGGGGCGWAEGEGGRGWIRAVQHTLGCCSPFPCPTCPLPLLISSNLLVKAGSCRTGIAGIDLQRPIVGQVIYREVSGNILSDLFQAI